MSQLPTNPPKAPSPAPLPRSGVKMLQTSTRWVDRLSAYLLPYHPDDTAAPDQLARPMIRLGLMLMVLLFGIIGSWAAFVPLATGAIAPGRVVSESASKAIQHLEGGIVKEILVQEGEKVKAGQILIRLENVSAEARNEQIRNQFITAKATENRLLAERDGKSSVIFDPVLTQREATDPTVKEALDSQRRLFATRKASLEGQINIFNQKIAQSDQETRGLREQEMAADQQVQLLHQEITTVEGLLKTGDALKPRLLALQRQEAQLRGQRGQAQAMESRASKDIEEAKISIINAKTEALNNVIKELKDTQLQLATLDEQGRASADVVRRVDIAAPIEGTVAGLAVHTIGGVVQPGQTLMTLVPINDRLIVEAHIAPQDIEAVHPGLIAQVKITAFKSRYFHPVKGKVISISTDRFDDPHTNESYYLARIEISQAELSSLGKVKLTAGMGAETLIVTGQRTMLSYIVQPIRESFGHAFHDQ